ncbi:hypothetical protein [Saccharothrix syringae]|nr:hypothetical protein [Saccharothrix syringae]
MTTSNTASASAGVDLVRAAALEALSEQWGALARGGTTTTWAEIPLDEG